MHALKGCSTAFGGSHRECLGCMWSTSSAHHDGFGQRELAVLHPPASAVQLLDACTDVGCDARPLLGRWEACFHLIGPAKRSAHRVAAAGRGVEAGAGATRRVVVDEVGLVDGSHCLSAARKIIYIRRRQGTKWWAGKCMGTRFRPTAQARNSPSTPGNVQAEAGACAPLLQHAGSSWVAWPSPASFLSPGSYLCGCWEAGEIPWALLWASNFQTFNGISSIDFDHWVFFSVFSFFRGGSGREGRWESPIGWMGSAAGQVGC
jgi:hypothetical protein